MDHVETTTTTQRPIFVRGFSRSGGTLVVTLLDAHPQIGMSYELYPKLLEALGESQEQVDGLRFILGTSLSLKLACKRIEDRGLRTFVARSERGGLSARQLKGLLKEHVRAGDGFDTAEGQLRFIGRCGELAASLKKRPFWGMKCTNTFGAYHSVFPNASFINVIRDGRDVLASQLSIGTFNKTPKQVGTGWGKTHKRFREFRARPGARAYELFYERLAHDPEGETSKLCDFLEIPYEPSMLSFHDQKLSIYKTSHLSMDRISKPIDVSRIGRWRQELAEKDLEEFYSAAGSELRELGYTEG
jgi:hypothetical protein